MHGHKIVVIEDEADLRFIYKLKLERTGFEVRDAGGGAEGFKIIAEFRPDLVLLDLLMPGMSGTEMLARLREQEWASNIRVVVLTNISKTEAPAALRFLSVDRYIVKAHHTPAQIAEIVQEVLHGGAPQ